MQKNNKRIRTNSMDDSAASFESSKKRHKSNDMEIDDGDFLGLGDWDYEEDENIDLGTSEEGSPSREKTRTFPIPLSKSSDPLTTPPTTPPTQDASDQTPRQPQPQAGGGKIDTKNLLQNPIPQNLLQSTPKAVNTANPKGRTTEFPTSSASSVTTANTPGKITATATSLEKAKPVENEEDPIDDDQLMRMDPKNFQDEDDIIEHFFARREALGNLLTGTLKDLENDKDTLDILKTAILSDLSLMNTIEDFQQEDKKKISIIVFGRKNRDKFMELTDEIVKWDVPLNTTIKWNRSSDIPLFGPSIRGKISPESLINAIQKEDKEIDVGKINYVSQRSETITTIFCADVITALKIHTLGQFNVIQDGKVFSARFVVLSTVKENYDVLKIGKFNVPPIPRLLVRAVNRRLQLEKSDTRVETMECLRNKSRKFYGQVLIFAKKFQEDDKKIIRGKYLNVNIEILEDSKRTKTGKKN